MKNKIKKMNTLNIGVNSIKNSLENDKFMGPSPNKTKVKSVLSQEYPNKNRSNLNIIPIDNINEVDSSQESNDSFISKNLKNMKTINYNINNKKEKLKIESINELENSDVKLTKSHTKVSEKKMTVKINNNNFKFIKKLDRKSTVQLINKNILKTLNKPLSTIRIFKTNLNDIKNINTNDIINILIDEDDKPLSDRNDLLIPEEDKIFDEFKKYNYFVKRFNKLYKINNNIENNEVDNKNNKSSKSSRLSKNTIENITKEKEQNKKPKKSLYDSTGKFVPSLLDKELFDCLYKTNDHFYSELKSYKKAKNTKKLKDYQAGLLEAIKEKISTYGYDRLKKNFDEILKVNKFKRRLNYKFLKNLETEEKKIISNVNRCNKYYLKSNISKGTIKNKFKVPKLKFSSIIKKEENKKWKEFIESRNATDRASRFSSTNSLKDMNKILKKDEIYKLKHSLFKK